MSEQRKKRITLAVTSDLTYDQRMMRIATSLQAAGYEVTLVGRERPISAPLGMQPYAQHRLRVRIDSTKLMYAVFWWKLFWWLLRDKSDALCVIDLDTAPPVLLAGWLKGVPRVYDAHELFAEQEETVRRPTVYRMWLAIERWTVRRCRHGYAVSESYVDYFQKKYGRTYAVVRNATVLRPPIVADKPERYILYQGAVNKGRCFEQLIPAMQWVDCQLVIVGDGNFMEQAHALARQYRLEDKVIFRGYVTPRHLPRFTMCATIGITLFVATSLSNELSLANRFFDYMHACVPQLGVRYPEYERINKRFEVAQLLDEVTPETVAAALNGLLTDETRYNRMQEACLRAREVYCWQEEEKRLLAVWASVFANV
jgi:glycosyltransferase involved in cell wall biosynthesis